MKKGFWVAARHYTSIFVIFVVVLSVLTHMMGGVILPDITVGGDAEGDTLPTVVIDAGHGGEDCGAVAVNGIYEKDINLSIATKVAELLRTHGYPVVETRTDDRLLYDPSTVKPGQKKTTDLKNRLEISEQLEDAIFLSIHMNSFTPSPSQKGMQIWYGGNGESAFQIAKTVKKYTNQYLQPNNHRNIVKSAGNMYLLDRATHPALLIECGFLSNPEEAVLLGEEKYQMQLSFVIFCAMIDVINQWGDTP